MIARIFAAACGLVLLSACATEETQQQIQTQSDLAAARVAEARRPGEAVRYNPLTVSNAVWSGSDAIRMHRGMPLPARYETARGVTLVSSAPVNLNDVAMAITQQTGVPVRFEAGAEQLAGLSAAPGGNPGGAAASGGAGGGNAARPSSVPMMPVAYEGPLSGLMETVASAFGVGWRYDGSAISISRFETRTFVIEALPADVTFTDGMQEPSSDSGSSSTTTTSSSSSGSTQQLRQSSELKTDLKFWAELKDNVAAMLGGVGSFTVSPSTGTITVVTTPSLMRNVSNYVAEENKRLSRQIAVNVEVFTVDLDNDENFDFTLDTAFRRLTNLGLNFSGPSGNSTGTGLSNLSVAIFNPEAVGELTSTFELLNSIGNATRVAQFPMTTINNRPVSRRIGRDRSYLASVNINQSDTFQNITLTPGVVREGFSLQLTPRMLPDGRILLQYSLQLTDIVTIREFTSGSSQIQLPETSNRVFVQQSVLQNGSTLILGGFDQEQVSLVSRGVGDPFNYLLGGGSDSGKTRTILFIAITPQEIVAPRSAENF